MYRLILLVTSVLSLAAAQNDRAPRIVGGRNAGIGEIPYQVSLRSFGSTFHFCGGALISNRWVVTAGTCVTGRTRNSINVVAGTVSLSLNGVGRRSTNIVLHHLFDPTSIDHNIGLVQTAAAFPMNQNIWPVAISSLIIRNEVPARISGFGATDVNAGANSDRLQVLSLVTASDADCNDIYTGVDLEANMCTSNGFGEGFCTTDLGGPLVWNSQLIGIANWHHPCGLGNMDIYVRISFYRLWIGSIAGV